uniref:Uncharacterized protein n=1 Tax=Populus alba TaxID=43335 RepID=A0A4U5MWB6_POPAL|nr:hypothetical protein D5086_0000296780 [Populus alba]
MADAKPISSPMAASTYLSSFEGDLFLDPTIQWGFFEGPFKGHAPDGEKVEFYGSGVLNVDESMRAEDVEIYYDPAELIGGLLISPSQSEPEDNTVNTATATHGCPFSKEK